MLKELDNTEMTSCFPVGNGGMGISLQHSGDADYSEQSLDTSLWKKSGRLQIGTGLVYCWIRLPVTGHIGFGSARIGIRVHVSDKLTAGWELDYRFLEKQGKSNPERGPQFFRMGFGYEWRTDLFMSIQIEKDSGLPVNIIGYTRIPLWGTVLFFIRNQWRMAGALYFKSGWKKNRLCIQIYTFI